MLLSFLMSLFTFLTITAAIFYIGYKKSITSRGNERRKTLEEQIQKELKDILSHGAIGTKEVLESRLSSSLPHNVSIIIYDENIVDDKFLSMATYFYYYTNDNDNYY